MWPWASAVVVAPCRIVPAVAVGAAGPGVPTVAVCAVHIGIAGLGTAVAAAVLAAVMIYRNSEQHHVTGWAYYQSSGG